MGVERVGGDGIFLEGYGDNKVQNSGASECGGNGLTSGANSVNCVVDSCNFENNDGHAVVPIGSTTIIQTECDASGQSGVRMFSGTDTLTIIGGMYTKNTNWSIDVESDNVTIRGATIESNGDGGVQIRGHTNDIHRCKITESGPHIDVRNESRNTHITASVFDGAGESVAVRVFARNVRGSPPDINEGRGATPTSGSLSIDFDGMFSEKPNINVTTEGEAIWWVSSWASADADNYEGATLSFVDSSGASVNLTVHWEATPVEY